MTGTREPSASSEPSTPGDVSTHLAGIVDAGRRADAHALVELMRSVTDEQPRLWGTTLGFGEYHYRYASGREGTTFKVGFAARKANLTIYLMSGLVGYDDLLAELGPHKTGKSCLYVKRLDDVDSTVLARLVRRSVAHLDRVAAEAGAIPRMSEMPTYRDED